jgi:hypothetical protein
MEETSSVAVKVIKLVMELMPRYGFTCLQSVFLCVRRDTVGQQQDVCPPHPSITVILLGFVERPENENFPDTSMLRCQ